MTLMSLDDGSTVLYDCNVTNNNEYDVLGYVEKIIGRGAPIDIFINSHRDADHMRGVKKVHENFPIQKIWDSGVTGNTPDSSEYRDYMDLRRRVGFLEIRAQKKWTFGRTLLRVMNSKNSDLKDDPNAQSIVLKVQHTDSTGGFLSSALLTGDTDASVWKYSIIHRYSKNDLKTQVLLASHHGSISFFDDPKDDKYYYTNHLEAMNPAMTVVSVGDNSHGHPDEKALELYEKHTRGSNKGNKLVRTDTHGNIRLLLKNEGGWTLWHGR